MPLFLCLILPGNTMTHKSSKSPVDSYTIMNEIVLPNYQGKNGHPIKMKPSSWNNLVQLKPTEKDSRLDFQLKKVIPAKISIVEVLDRAIILNLNTKKDWKSFLENS